MSKTITFSDAAVEHLSSLIGLLPGGSPLLKDLESGGIRWNGKISKAATRSAPYRKYEEVTCIHLDGFVPTEEPVKPGTFIIWCPTSTRPPTVKFDTFEKAKSVSEQMAQKNPGIQFHVCRLEGHAEVQPKAVFKKA